MVFRAVLFTLLALSPLARSELTPHPHSHHDAALDIYRRQSTLPGPSALSPAVDPFYKPPAGSSWKSKANGAVLRSRQIKAYGNGVQSSYQLLYKTSSVNGTALAAVTTVWVPFFADKGKLIVATRPENAISIDCAPSWRFINGTVDDQRFFDKRWVVTSVDHEGPDSAFGAGRTQGRITLDAARAVIAYKPIGMQANAKIALAGYSGGAAAAGWAATLAAAYAKELNIVAAAYGGVPADLPAILKYVDGTLYSGLAYLGVFGIARGYSAVQQRLEQILTADGRYVQSVAGNKCLSEAFQVLAGKKLLDYNSTTDGPNLLSDPIFKTVLDTLLLGGIPAETPKMPQLIYQGAIDQIIPPASVDAMVDRYCATGANLIYRRVTLADHFLGVTDADVAPFIEARFNGVPFPSGCRRVSVTFPWDRSAANSFFPIFKSQSIPSIASDTSVDADDRKLAVSTKANKAERAKHVLKLHGHARHRALKEFAKKFRAFGAI